MAGRSEIAARVHVAAEPMPALDEPNRIVQPCARCGIVLLSLDLENLPNVMAPPDGEEPRPLAWFGVGDQYERDPGYPDGTMTMTCLVSDAEIERDGVALCDPNEVPADVETFRTVVPGDPGVMTLREFVDEGAHVCSDGGTRRGAHEDCSVCRPASDPHHADHRHEPRVEEGSS